MNLYDLQENFDNLQKAKAQSRNAKNAKLEQTAEQILLPILVKNFKRLQDAFPEAEELHLVAYVSDSQKSIYIPVAGRETEKVFAYDLGERAKREGIELPYSANQLCRAICKTAPRIHHGFGGFESKDVPNPLEAGKTYDFLLCFATTEYKSCIEKM